MLEKAEGISERRRFVSGPTPITKPAMPFQFLQHIAFKGFQTQLGRAARQ
jgi:hypothetical protein